MSNEKELDVIGQIRRKYNPLNQVFKSEKVKEFTEEPKEVLPNLEPNEAFGLNNEDIPF